MASKEVAAAEFNDPLQFRAAAEMRLAHSPASEVSARSDTELLHELQVHQIELEMQNKALTEAQIALEESRDRFVDFYECAPVGYLTITDKGLIADINLTGAALLGAESKQLLLKPFARFVIPADEDRYHAHFFGVLKTAEKLTCELRLLRRDGAHVYARLDSLRVIKDGVAPALRVVLTDITERRQLETGLAEIAAKAKCFSDALDNVPSSYVYMKDLRHKYFYANKATLKLFKCSAEELIGSGDEKFFLPDTVKRLKAVDDRVLESGESTMEEIDVSPDSPERRVYLEVKTPIADEAGRIIGLCGISTDITERKQMEEALRESELRFSLFMENLPACAYIKDEQGRHIFVNAALATQTMTTVGSLLGKANGDLWPKDIAAKLDSADAAVITSRSPLTIEEDVLMNNAVRTYLTTKFSIERANGETFLAGVSFDITERKQAEAELAQYRDHLEELVSTRTSELAQSRDAAEAGDRAKTIFLANMSHELRTPMNGVMGMIDLVLMRATDPKQIDWLKKSKGAAQRLVNVVNDIIDFSKIEAERLPLEEKNFSLSLMIDDAIAMHDLTAEAKGLKLTREIPATFPDELSGDAFRVRQILLNFLGNACKFSDQGTITVRVSAVEQDGDSVLACIEVEDQGIGISPEQQALLFQAFAQADGSLTRKYGGSGLGLIISKRLANLMGGDAGMVSQEGHGSTFWATARLRLTKTSEVGI